MMNRKLALLAILLAWPAGSGASENQEGLAHGEGALFDGLSPRPAKNPGPAIFEPGSLTSDYRLGRHAVMSEKALLQAFPAFYLDHAGFEPPAGDPLSVQGLDPDLPVFPLFPVRKSRWSKKIVGVVIPERYLGLPEAAPRGGTFISMGAAPLHPQVRRAFELVRHAGYMPVFYDNRVIGLPPGSPLVIQKGFTLGVKMDFNSLFDPKTLVIDESKGLELNPLQPAEQFIENVRAILSPERAEETLTETLRFLPYLQYYLAQNARFELIDPKSSRPFAFKSVFNAGMSLPQGPRPTPPVLIPEGEFSSELQQAMDSLRRRLEQETRWKGLLAQPVAWTRVVQWEEGHVLVQQSCDYLAAAYGVPEELWPRCRIAASMSPNAYAMPSGDIFVTAGLVGVISDLDGLLFILGHEIGHVLARHGSKHSGASDMAQRGFNAASTAGALFSMSAGAGTLGSVTLASWFPKVLASQQISNMGLRLIYMGELAGLMAYSREHEWEADRIGHQGALAVGARPQALEVGWGEFHGYLARYAGISEGAVRRLFASHPPMDRRREELVSRQPFYGHLRQRHLGADGEHVNRLSSAYYDDYARLHGIFKPMSQAYGEYLQARARAGERRPLDFLRQSLTAPGGLCASYALSGEGAADHR